MLSWPPVGSTNSNEIAPESEYKSSFSFLVSCISRSCSQWSSNVRTLKSNVKIADSANSKDTWSLLTIGLRAEYVGVQTQVTIIRPFDLKFLNFFPVRSGIFFIIRVRTVWMESFMMGDGSCENVHTSHCSGFMNDASVCKNSIN